MNYKLLCLPVVGVFSASSVVGAQDYRYTVFELPSLVQNDQFAAAGPVTLDGDAVGHSGVGYPYSHAVIWAHDGGVIDLGTLGGDNSGAGAINSLGEIVGASSWLPGQSPFVGHACLWRNGEVIDLGTLGGESSSAFAINDSTQIVGNSEFELQSYRIIGYIWENGIMTALDDPWPSANLTEAWDINSSGHVVGEGASLDGQYNAMLWIDKQPIDLGSLSGEGSTARATNDTDRIVGRSRSSNGNSHAVVWVDRQIMDIHDQRFGDYSWPEDINNVDQILGSIGDELATREMFVMQLGQPLELLKDLIPPNLRLNWRIDKGKINDVGMIGCYALEEGNFSDTWALLLTPVNPTMTLEGPQPGRAGTTNGLRVTGVAPGARVTFLYSRHGGGTRIPGCDLQQNALQLDRPTIIGTTVANENGVATITRTVPLIARGQTILFQAVVQNECAISQLVVHTFD